MLRCQASYLLKSGGIGFDFNIHISFSINIQTALKFKHARRPLF